MTDAQPTVISEIHVKSVSISATRDLEPRPKWSGDEPEKVKVVCVHHKVYVLTTEANGKTYISSHRYSEFQDLHYHLKSTYADVELPKFPGPTLFKASQKDVDLRIRLFGQYFREIFDTGSYSDALKHDKKLLVFLLKPSRHDKLFAELNEVDKV